MTPLVPHVPPRAVAASARVSGDPDLTSIRFSFPSAKKPIWLESGDQNGKSAFSVPFSGCATGALNGRTQIIGGASSVLAIVAISRPFGDKIAVAVSNAKKVPSGAVISEYRRGEGGRRLRIT